MFNSIEGVRRRYRKLYKTWISLDPPQSADDRVQWVFDDAMDCIFEGGIREANELLDQIAEEIQLYPF